MSSSSVYGGGRTVGRGPSGRVRNMQAMHTPKLIAVERLLIDDGGDALALARCQAELRKRGFAVGTYKPFATQEAALAAVGTTEAEVQDEYDELLDWLAEVTN